MIVQYKLQGIILTSMNRLTAKFQLTPIHYLSKLLHSGIGVWQDGGHYCATVFLPVQVGDVWCQCVDNGGMLQKNVIKSTTKFSSKQFNYC